MNKRQKKKQLKKQQIIREQKQQKEQSDSKIDELIEEKRQKEISTCGKTQELFRKKEEVIDEIIFDQYSFQWRIYYHTDNEKDQKEFCIGVYNDTKLDQKNINRINIYKRQDIDKNLIYALSAFDNWHSDSTAVRDCLTDSLKCKIVYDLSRKPKNMHITEDRLQEIREGALSEKKNHGAIVIRYRNKIIAGALVVLSLIVGITTFGSNGKKKDYKDDDRTITITHETEEEKTTTEIEELANTTVEEVTTELQTTTEEVTTEQQEATEDIKNLQVEQEDIIEEVNTDCKLTDSFKLDNSILVDDTRNPKKKAYTSGLKCDDYKIALTAVLVNKKIVAIDGVEELENKSLKEIEKDYKNIYGQDAQVYVNFNGYKDGNQIYTYIGWGHIDEFKDMKTNSNYNTISKLKQIKSNLLSRKTLQKTHKM